MLADGGVAAGGGVRTSGQTARRPPGRSGHRPRIEATWSAGAWPPKSTPAVDGDPIYKLCCSDETRWTARPLSKKPPRDEAERRVILKATGGYLCRGARQESWGFSVGGIERALIDRFLG